MNREIEEIENKAVRLEIRKLSEIFEEAFINQEFEFVICHPIYLREAYPMCLSNGGRMVSDTGKVILVPKRGIYCDCYFSLAHDCESKLDVQCKVIEWLSRAACKTHWIGRQGDDLIHKYILRGINAYFGTNFSPKDMETIYGELGYGVNHELTIRFIESKFDMNVLGEKK